MNKQLVKKIRQIDRLLEENYGRRIQTRSKDPLTELIMTVLSQNTNDRNRDRAFESLKRSFPTWQQTAEASPAKLASAIRVGGLAGIKANRILNMLRDIHKVHGSYDLDFLKSWSDAKIRDYLLAIEGVGPKTAACVLAFALGRDVMPVDTHVHRVSGRLGILPEDHSADKAHAYFLEFRGAVNLYQLHLNLIEHGRKICHARNPQCGACQLKRHCRYYRQLKNSGAQAA